MLIYHFQLPAHQDAKAFVKFMKAEYFPAIFKGAARVGPVTEMTLFQGDTTSITHDFFWHLGGLVSGHPRVEDDAVQRKFESFNVKLELAGDYEPVVTWREDGQA
jgi:hypothetical protein